MVAKSTPEHMVSASIENYLKAIFRLEQDGLPGETNRISEMIGGITPASVTAMVKRLAEMDLVEYVPYQGVKLTPSGRRVSLEVLRRHRLIELYLVDQLGFSWDEVHEEAEQLEHYVSNKLVDRMAEKLGNPDFDPHGDPIPGVDGSLPSRESVSLADCTPSRTMKVSRVLDQSPLKLQFLAECGLTPGAEVVVLARDNYVGTVLLHLNGRDLSLDRSIASRILMIP